MTHQSNEGKQVSNKEQLYRWVKASERLPEVRFNYHVKVGYHVSDLGDGIWNTASLFNDETKTWEHPNQYDSLTGRPMKLNVIEWLEPLSGDAEKDKDWMDDSIDVVSMNIGRLEINCFDEESEMSIKVGRSGYQSLNMDEAKELANFIISHIKIETDSI